MAGPLGESERRNSIKETDAIRNAAQKSVNFRANFWIPKVFLSSLGAPEIDPKKERYFEVPLLNFKL